MIEDYYLTIDKGLGQDAAYLADRSGKRESFLAPTRSTPPSLSDVRACQDFSTYLVSHQASGIMHELLPRSFLLNFASFLLAMPGLALKLIVMLMPEIIIVQARH